MAPPSCLMAATTSHSSHGCCLPLPPASADKRSRSRLKVSFSCSTEALSVERAETEAEAACWAEAVVRRRRWLGLRSPRLAFVDGRSSWT
jgi:hypothetical protein